MFRGWVNDAAASVEQLRISMAAHGLSVVEVSRRSVSQPWKYDPQGRKNRRITAHTPFKVTGPAAGSSYLKTTADPKATKVLGTLNNCSGSVTPWGTILSGEENFNQYFRVTAAPTNAETASGYQRYGIATEGGRDWYRADNRFDMAVEPNEPHRFGWVVEIDPDRPRRAGRGLPRGRRAIRLGARLHPPGRRQGLPDQDGPARGRPAQPGDRQGVHGLYEQHQPDGRPGRRRFDWAILVVCGNPDDPSTYFSGYDKTKVSPISCPDNVAFDRAGHLWIATDGQPDSIGLNDALHAVPISGEERGHVQQFLAVPIGAETCGPVITEDGAVRPSSRFGARTAARARDALEGRRQRRCR